jgi:hypothetical protein
MRPFLALLAAAAFGLAAAPANAQSNPADDADLKCMLVIGAMVAAPTANDQMKALAPLAFTYYYGKLKGRSPGLNIEDRLMAVMATLQGGSPQQDAVRCGAELKALGDETKALGDKFKSLGGPPKTP